MWNILRWLSVDIFFLIAIITSFDIDRLRDEILLRCLQAIISLRFISADFRLSAAFHVLMLLMMLKIIDIFIFAFGAFSFISSLDAAMITPMPAAAAITLISKMYAIDEIRWLRCRLLIIAVADAANIIISLSFHYDEAGQVKYDDIIFDISWWEVADVATIEMLTATLFAYICRWREAWHWHYALRCHHRRHYFLRWHAWWCGRWCQRRRNASTPIIIAVKHWLITRHHAEMPRCRNIDIFRHYETRWRWRATFKDAISTTFHFAFTPITSRACRRAFSSCETIIWLLSFSSFSADADDYRWNYVYYFIFFFDIIIITM